jgi:hypothetical protein
MPLRIDEAHSGFPGIAHGGYLGGLLARELAVPGAVEVAFRRPARTGRDLELAREGERLLARDGDHVVAEASPARLEIASVPPVDLRAAYVASESYPGASDHPFPGCCCCGPRSSAGLRIFPGPVAGREVMAAPWTPRADLAGPGGALGLEQLWAALDCPAIWALVLTVPRGAPEQVVTGRMAVEVRGRVEPGRELVVASWPLHVEGRKRLCAAALFSASGNVLAIAQQTCIVIEPGVPLGRWGLKPA